MAWILMRSYTFTVVLSMEFLRQFNIVPLPRYKRNTSKQLSAMQFKRGIKKGKVTYLATLCIDKEEATHMKLLNEEAQVLNEFKDVMQSELSKKLPSRKEVDHTIELEFGAKPSVKAPYHMSPPELEELKRHLKELLDVDFIQSSKITYEAPILFQKKYNGSLKLFIDYMTLNKVISKNKYPILLIVDMFGQFGGERYFTKLDLKLGYYQVRIAADDEPKTMYFTR